LNAAAQQADNNVATVVVFGQGNTRQVQDVTRDDLIKITPGTSPLKTLDKLPGVSFESADPFGAYEWSTRFSVRGFSQNQMGFTLDGVPLGDMSYGNNNGLHISRAISSENIGRVSLSQGAGSVGTTSTSNLGGTVQFFSSAPADKMEFTAAETVGSNATSRTFLRADTGVLSTGGKAYISYTRQRTDKWKGDGGQNQDMINSKLVQPLGANTKLSAFINYSDRKETDYQDLSLEMVNRLGYNWDNYAPDWQRAINAAKGVYTGGVNNMDDAYYQGAGLRKDTLMGTTLDSVFGDFRIRLTGYHHSNTGQGHWFTPYQASQDGTPISIRTTEYGISRNGAVADLTWENDMHSVNAGIWAESSNHALSRNYYNVNGSDLMLQYLSNPFMTAFKQQFNTSTTQFYVQDTIALMNDKLHINAGFKSSSVKINAVNLIGSRSAGDLDSKKSFLPQLGVNYALSRNDELFASASRNMRAFQPGVDGPFNQSQDVFNATKSTLKPETSRTVDAGYRFKTDSLVGSVAAYYTQFDDRIIKIANCAGIVGCPNSFVNVGSVVTRGVEIAGLWTIDRNWSVFSSLTMNDSTYQDNYYDNNKLINITDKQVVDSPKNMLKLELSYDNTEWFSRLGGKYTDKRFYTYTNDAKVPAFWLYSLSAGYKPKSFGMLKDISVQLNVENLFNKQYFSSMGTNGFDVSDPKGSLVTLQAGAPRQLFLSFSAKM
jgi:iron complex outermembrane receptor protein